MNVPSNLVDLGTIEDSFCNAIEVRNSMLNFDGRTFSSKVCCIYDRFILFGQETTLKIKTLEDTCVSKFLNPKTISWNECDISLLTPDIRKKLMMGEFTTKILVK